MICWKSPLEPSNRDLQRSLAGGGGSREPAAQQSDATAAETPSAAFAEVHLGRLGCLVWVV